MLSMQVNFADLNADIQVDRSNAPQWSVPPVYFVVLLVHHQQCYRRTGNEPSYVCRRRGGFVLQRLGSRARIAGGQRTRQPKD